MNLDVLGLAEVADLLGVSKQQVNSWMRESRFPEPAQRVRATPLWLRPDIEAWAAKHNKPLAHA